ncbi:hypothetical protein K6675_003162 [Vibrio parahaemolyticus]|nr:hypothetical protein [Vibrio parahaemolyticus]EHK9100256.1 hypothetical protein [Vibrio parahaemolyticus]EIA1332540.1 hypothetical protein [Vibrio parahaemolyticus]EIT7135462.1 hypothetical protein [Vibrio parahaemolyticus]EIV8630854.1 hypothetical protein [Vibrio parahaemolyticus]
MKAVWEGIAKKFNGLGLSGISMACTGLAVVIASPQEPLLQCALCLLMFNMVIHSFETLTYCFERQLNEMAPNE